MGAIYNVILNKSEKIAFRTSSYHFHRQTADDETRVKRGRRTKFGPNQALISSYAAQSRFEDETRVRCGRPHFWGISKAPRMKRGSNVDELALIHFQFYFIFFYFLVFHIRFFGFSLKINSFQSTTFKRRLPIGLNRGTTPFKNHRGQFCFENWKN